MKRLLFVLPLVVFAGLATAFAIPLLRGDDPSVIPSALIDQAVPGFDLPPVPGRTAPTGADRQVADGRVPDGLAVNDLATGEVVLLNVFASWCAPCLAEHPIITRLAQREGITVHGLSYKDDPVDAVAWLERHGDPYSRVGMDLEGRVGIDFGVYGVPETFIIDGDGRIRYRHAGPLTAEIVRDEVLPLVRRLRSGTVTGPGTV